MHLLDVESLVLNQRLPHHLAGINLCKITCLQDGPDRVNTDNNFACLIHEEVSICKPGHIVVKNEAGLDALVLLVADCRNEPRLRGFSTVMRNHRQRI